jgi:hypothetical protein
MNFSKMTDMELVACIADATAEQRRRLQKAVEEVKSELRSYRVRFVGGDGLKYQFTMRCVEPDDRLSRMQLMELAKIKLATHYLRGDSSDGISEWLGGRDVLAMPEQYDQDELRADIKALFDSISIEVGDFGLPKQYITKALAVSEGRPAFSSAKLQESRINIDPLTGEAKVKIKWTDYKFPATKFDKEELMNICYYLETTPTEGSAAEWRRKLLLKSIEPYRVE